MHYLFTTLDITQKSGRRVEDVALFAFDYTFAFGGASQALHRVVISRDSPAAHAGIAGKCFEAGYPSSRCANES